MDVQATVPIPQSRFAVFLAAMESATINAKVPEPSQGEEADTTHVVDDAGGKVNEGVIPSLQFSSLSSNSLYHS